MASLVSTAKITLRNPAVLAGRLLDLLGEHDIECVTEGMRTIVDLDRGRGILVVSARSLLVSIEAREASDLEVLRAGFAEHLVRVADKPIDIRWNSVPSIERCDNFRKIRLIRVRDVTSRLRRLTFAGTNLERFATDIDLHVRLYFPPPGLPPSTWLDAGVVSLTARSPNGLLSSPRYYTIRTIDPAAGTLDIDFVLHSDGGPGASFADMGRPGDILGMVGPLGRSLPGGDWHILAGDETALPAIARMLEAMPSDAQGSAVIEIAAIGEQIALKGPPGISVRWLYRDGAPAGLPNLLEAALRTIDIPKQMRSAIWAGCESSLAKRLRQYFEKERHVPRERISIAGYWTR